MLYRAGPRSLTQCVALRRCLTVDLLQRMNLIIKGDTSGVVEAIKGALQGLPQESVVLRYLLCAAGDITTSDVDLAAASGGMVVGFNLSPDENVLSHAKNLGKCACLQGCC